MTNNIPNSELPRVEITNASVGRAVIIQFAGSEHVFHTGDVEKDWRSAMNYITDELTQPRYIRGASVASYLEANKALVRFDKLGFLTRNKTEWEEAE